MRDDRRPPRESRERFGRIEDSPFASPPERFKKKRPPRPWAQQAERWRGPSRAFKCCGTLYRAMTDQVLAWMREKHNARCHVSQPR